MDALDDLWRVEHQTVHPSFEPLSPEILDAGILELLTRAHRSVKNEHAIAERVEEWRSISARHAHDVTRERLRDTLANRLIRFEETLFGTTPTPPW